MLMSLSEGSRESLRRLSSFTWMAEELLQVTDYFLSSKPVSIVGIMAQKRVLLEFPLFVSYYPYSSKQAIPL